MSTNPEFSKKLQTYLAVISKADPNIEVIPITNARWLLTNISTASADKIKELIDHECAAHNSNDNIPAVFCKTKLESGGRCSMCIDTNPRETYTVDGKTASVYELFYAKLG